MSRVDEALRRAQFELAGGPVSVSVEPPTAVVDRSVLDRYAVEKRAEPPALPPRAMPPVPPPAAPATVRPAPIPPAPSAPWTLRLPESLQPRLVTSEVVNVEAVEQYRRLATALLAAQAGRTLKTLMVSSAMPSEGKTLTVTNLALTLSESYGKHVLLVDADFRRPSIHHMFGLSNAAGLADGLRSNDTPLKVARVSETLSVLPTGPTDAYNSMADLSSDRMHQLITEAAAQFDWVLIDTPPVGLLSDAHLVAQHTDGVLFVIAAGSTPFAIVQRAIAELGRERVIGTLLNRVDARVLPVHHYYGRYYTVQS
jgi:protein-tyrosine kinase